MPKKAWDFQNNLNAFSKEREITVANYERKTLQLSSYFGAKTSKLFSLSVNIDFDFVGKASSQ